MKNDQNILFKRLLTLNWVETTPKVINVKRWLEIPSMGTDPHHSFDITYRLTAHTHTCICHNESPICDTSQWMKIPDWVAPKEKISAQVAWSSQFWLKHWSANTLFNGIPVERHNQLKFIIFKLTSIWKFFVFVNFPVDF